MTRLPTHDPDGTPLPVTWSSELPGGPASRLGEGAFGDGMGRSGEPGSLPGFVPAAGRFGSLGDDGGELPTAPTDDDDLVEKTRRQIRRLTQEVVRLAQAPLSLGEFHEAFLIRVTQALAAQGGAIWLKDDEQGLVLAHQIDLPVALVEGEATRQARHRGLLLRLIEKQEPALVPPRTGTGGEEGLENPTPWLLVLAPLRVGDETVGMVEVFLRGGSGPATQRGYLRFLVQMCEYAGVFLKNHRLREMQERQQLLERLDRFVAEAHRSLDLDPTLFAIVNEGRAVIDVDRVAIAIRRRGGWEIRAVSGLDTVERRSAELKAAARLVAAVCRAREPLWYDGDDAELPPQLEDPLHEYLDLSHAKGIGLIPLMPPGDDSDEDGERDANADRNPIGCLLIERIAQPRDAVRERRRGAIVARHAERALANALELQSMPLVGPLRAIGRWRREFAFGRLLTAGLIVAAIAAVVVGLVLIPYPLILYSPGQLLPTARREVFAPTDAMVDKLMIGDDPSRPIRAGEPLMSLVDERLMEEINQLEGRSRQLEQRIASLQHQKVENFGKLSLVEEQQLEAEIAAARVDVESAGRSLELKRKELRLLEVAAPMDGTVIDDQLEQRLYRRPVERGQVLLTMVDPSGPWEVELYLPEKRLWELQESAARTGKPLEVEFELGTLPGERFRGTVVEIDRFAVVRPGEGNTVLVRVTADREAIPDEVRVAGARVEAKIACGDRNLAYVLFNDFWQMIRSRVLFRFG